MGWGTFGKTGNNKVVMGYLTGSYNVATIGAHTAALTTWADLGVMGTSLNFWSGATMTKRWTINSSGNLVANGAKTISADTGILTLSTTGGNYDIELSPGGTGGVTVNLAPTTNNFSTGIILKKSSSTSYIGFVNWTTSTSNLNPGIIGYGGADAASSISIVADGVATRTVGLSISLRTLNLAAAPSMQLVAFRNYTTDQ